MSFVVVVCLFHVPCVCTCVPHNIITTYTPYTTYTGNVGNMMLVSVSTVCAETELHLTPEGVSVQECIAEGVGYVMFSIAVSVLLTFGLVPNILRRGKMYGELEEQEVCGVVCVVCFMFYDCMCVLVNVYL